MLQVLEAAAVTVVVTQGTIFRPLRERGPKLWRELVNCPLCLGWWIGAAGALGDTSYSELVLQLSQFPDQAFLGVFARSCWAIAWHVASAGAMAACFALLFRRVTEYLDVAAFQLDQQTEKEKQGK